MSTVIRSLKVFRADSLISTLEEKILEELALRNGIATIDELGLIQFWFRKVVHDYDSKFEVLDFFRGQGGYIAYVVTNLYCKGLIEIYFSHDVWCWVSIGSSDFSRLSPQAWEILLKLTDVGRRRIYRG